VQEWCSKDVCVSAVQLGVELPEPQQGRLLDLQPSSDGTRAVAALQVRLTATVIIKSSSYTYFWAVSGGHAATSVRDKQTQAVISETHRRQQPARLRPAGQVAACMLVLAT
jgi:hypothetical protein